MLNIISNGLADVSGWLLRCCAAAELGDGFLLRLSVEGLSEHLELAQCVD